ncbi:MAG TPA: toll/interleukin-1 receptor domain-containing protein [Candidatus Limnocylindrales bacterium]|nr:toll/interleukin-1 receptor domain-containing protein [Candidatus Limnocylindrales bacterium]
MDASKYKAKGMTKNFVFISYSREDRAFVDRLSQDLRSGGVTTWQDTKEIAAGENWRLAIEGGLRRASALLYVASARSVNSHWMSKELEAVFGRGARIIPVVLDDEGEQGLPHFLRDFQWVDFRQGYEAALPQLLTALRSLRSDRPAEPRPEQAKGYVFLSYAEEDAPFVDDLKEFLKQHNYGYWDYRESDRDYHADLYLELESVIQQAAATLSFLSPDWKRSRTAVKEYYFSLEVGVPVFLLRVRNPGPTLAVAGMPYIDFSEDHRAGFVRLERELSRKGL